MPYIPVTLVEEAGGSAPLKFYDSGELGSAQASFDVTSIPGGYASMKILLLLRGTKSATTCNIIMRFNSDSSAIYAHQGTVSFSSTAAAGQAKTETSAFTGSGGIDAVGGTAPTDYVSSTEVEIPNYDSATVFKAYNALGGTIHGTAAGDSSQVSLQGMYRSASPITQVTVTPDTGNWDAGSRLIVWLFP